MRAGVTQQEKYNVWCAEYVVKTSEILITFELYIAGRRIWINLGRAGWA